MSKKAGREGKYGPRYWSIVSLIEAIADAKVLQVNSTVRERVLGGLMDRYLIETLHTEQNCRDLVDLVSAAGYLNHFDWGCMGGVHCGWAIIEAENEPQARLAVSPLVRGQALVVKIVNFTQSMLNSSHQS